MTVEIRASSAFGTIGTEEQETQDDWERTAVTAARADIQEILGNSSSKTFWLDTRSILSALSSKDVQLPASLRRFHNRTAWAVVEHHVPKVRGEDSETWEMRMHSISGIDYIDYPNYEFLSTDGKSYPTILEEITDRDGKKHNVLRQGIAAPSDLPLVSAVLGFIKEAVASDKIHPSQIIGL